MTEGVLKCYLVRLPQQNFLDHHTAFEERLLQSNVSETLTEVNSAGDAILRLTESSSVSYDGLVYRFALRKGMRFHDGAEIHSDDVISQLSKVLRLKRSLSQLHHIIAKDDSGVGGFAIKRISRHRFEVKLNCRTTDFLFRLSLPELSIRQRKTGASCGRWRINHWDDHLVRLVPFEDHFEYEKPSYSCVELSRIPSEYNHHLSEESYLFLYPGLLFKSPVKENMTDVYCRPLHSCLTYYIELRSQPRHAEMIKAVFANAAIKSFVAGEAYVRFALNGFFPERHLLHSSRETRPVSPLSSPVNVSLALSSGFPVQALKGFVERLAQFNIHLKVVEDSDEADALLHQVFCGHSNDIYTPLRQLVPDKKQLKYLFGPDSANFLVQNCSQTVNQIVKSDRLIPLLITPYMARSNRQIVPTNDHLIAFHGVQASAESRRKIDLQDKGLRAIGSAMQMFAHDIKKPFSMMQAILNLAETSGSGDRVGDLLIKHYPQIKRSIRTANQLLQDVVEIGSEAPPHREPTSLREVVQKALHDCCAGDDGLELKFSYRLQHRYQIHVDNDKIVRVLNNIITNAIQAMSGKGRIWFTSREVDESFLEFAIGNSGSYIPEKLRKELFDQFFTRQKRKGTGLGLAIVKKIINDHGGQVWCDSDKESGTVFFMTLPLAHGLDQSHFELIDSSENLNDMSKHHEQTKANVSLLRPKRVMLIDDDNVYRTLFAQLLSKSELEQHRIKFEFASDAQSACEKLASGPVDLLIVDIYLEHAVPRGIEVIELARSLYPEMKICAHSTESPFDLQLESSKRGADIFIPKPLNRDQLVRLINSLERDPPESKIIIVLDDDAIFLEMWEESGLPVKVYTHPELFFQDLYQKVGFRDRIGCLVTDFKFDGQNLDGSDVLAKVRGEDLTFPVMLLSDYVDHKVTDRFDLALAKNDPKAIAVCREILLGKS